MADETAWRVTLFNDGVRHPDWDADGPIAMQVTVAAVGEEAAREAVLERWKEEHGWIVQGVEGPVTRQREGRRGEVKLMSWRREEVDGRAAVTLTFVDETDDGFTVDDLHRALDDFPWEGHGDDSFLHWKWAWYLACPDCEDIYVVGEKPDRRVCPSCGGDSCFVMPLAHVPRDGS